MKKKIALFVLILTIIISGYGFYRYIDFNAHYVSSNAVFVKSDSLTNLSFKLGGKIEKIYVKEGSKIKKGELLAKLDIKELTLKEKDLNSSILALSKNISALIIQKEKLNNDLNLQLDVNKNNIDKLKKSIEAKKFIIRSEEINLDKLKRDYLRFRKLFKNKKISKDKFEKIKTAYFSNLAKLKADKLLLSTLFNDLENLKLKNRLIKNSFKELDRLEKLIKANKDKLNSLKVKLALVKENIKNSFLYAPFNGIVAKKFANEKEVIGKGRRVLSVVDLNDLYVLNLLEETKMKGVKKGCSVKIHIDALDKDFDGVVDKILPASAATFALLPRDISSGEFTKLAQRFYVRIKFIQIPKGLKVGMSGEVVIRKCN